MGLLVKRTIAVTMGMVAIAAVIGVAVGMILA